jgi:zinc/manganese transport system substrate-binding protein
MPRMLFRRMMMKRIVLLALLFFCFTSPSFAKINVVATLPWIGSIASYLGKERINVTTLVKPNQDPHLIEAKPSMILASRKADIIMYNGLDLEIGYLPLLIESSRNPKIQPGQKGNFDCSRYVTVLEKPVSVDRSMGDVHPLGNPHYHFSPGNIGKIADGMAQALSEVDPANGEFYRANGMAFQKLLQEKEKEWMRTALRGKKFIAYHKFFEYLAHDFGFEIIGYIEEKPGIPPSASHIEKLVASLRQEKPNAILTTGYYERKAPDYLSQKTGVKVVVVPNDVGSVPQAKDWFSLMDQVLAVLQ